MTEVSIAPEFLGIFLTLIIFLISFSVDDKNDKTTLWQPILLWLDTPISLATGIYYLGLSNLAILSITFWVGIVMFCFAILLSFGGCYYAIQYGRN
jgi:hypothetical protein